MASFRFFLSYDRGCFLARGAIEVLLLCCWRTALFQDDVLEDDPAGTALSVFDKSTFDHAFGKALLATVTEVAIPAPQFPSCKQVSCQHFLIERGFDAFVDPLPEYVLVGEVVVGSLQDDLGWVQSIVLPVDATFDAPAEDCPALLIPEFFGQLWVAFAFRDFDRERD